MTRRPRTLEENRRLRWRFGIVRGSFRLAANAKLVYELVSDLDRDTEEGCWMREVDLAKQLGLDAHTFRDHRDALASYQLLRVVPRKKVEGEARYSLFAMLPVALQQDPPPGKDPDVWRPAIDAQVAVLDQSIIEIKNGNRGNSPVSTDPFYRGNPPVSGLTNRGKGPASIGEIARQIVGVTGKNGAPDRGNPPVIPGENDSNRLLSDSLVVLHRSDSLAVAQGPDGPGRERQISSRTLQADPSVVDRWDAAVGKEAVAPARLSSADDPRPHGETSVQPGEGR